MKTCYFGTGDPEGKVGLSLLVVPCEHARLSNFDNVNSGRFINDEQFVFAAKTYIRKSGPSANGFMDRFVALRGTSPYRQTVKPVIELGARSESGASTVVASDVRLKNAQ